MNKTRYNQIVFTEKEKDDIISQYQSGVSSVKIGKQYNVGHKTILKLLHASNIEVNQAKKVRKYTLNENYFDQIDTPTKAYILGFLYADGYNSSTKCTISLSLQEEDYEILNRIRLEVGSNKPPRFIDYSNKHDFGYVYKNQYQITFCSKHMSETLSEIGMTQCKSLVLTFPSIPQNLYSHFVRGYFDGDGSLCSYMINENNIHKNLSITSTNAFCQMLCNIALEIGINGHIYDASCHNDITKVFTISGNQCVKKFCDWMYQDADIYLNRKYQKYISCFYADKSIIA